MKVPLVVRIPEKFRQLVPSKPGGRVTEPVSFVDLAPTLLSFSGLDAPAQMQGRPFLGTKRDDPAADVMEFLSADPWEMHNLAADPAHAERLAALRERLQATINEVRDTGLVPEPLFQELAGESTLAMATSLLRQHSTLATRP